MYGLLAKSGLQYEADVAGLLVALGRRRRRTVFLDVGANISYFPLLTGAVFGDRFDIHAFEPMPALREMGARGLDANRVTANLRGEALTDHIGTGEFHLSAATDSSNSLNPTFRESKDVISVDLSTLDELFVRQGVSEVLRASLAGDADDTECILMIDTESTEPDVLVGGDELVARVRPHIVCEVLAGRTEARLEEFVERHGYLRYRLTADALVLESEIVGDHTYQHRDWYFAPEPVDPAVAADFTRYTRAFLGARPPTGSVWRRLAARIAR